MVLAFFPKDAPNSSKPHSAATAVRRKDAGIITCIEEKRALMCDLLLRRKTVAELAAAIDCINTDVLTVSDDNFACTKLQGVIWDHGTMCAH
jgi:Asp/Glu/hydantoin racemase